MAQKKKPKSMTFREQVKRIRRGRSMGFGRDKARARLRDEPGQQACADKETT